MELPNENKVGSMNPLTINPLALLGAGALAIALGFGSGWTANGWRLGAELSDLKATHAGEQATQAATAITDMKADAASIHAAATEYAAIESTLAPKIAALTKELKNAPKLPPGCRPDDFRVRNLEAAVDAANAAAARH